MQKSSDSLGQRLSALVDRIPIFQTARGATPPSHASGAPGRAATPSSHRPGRSGRTGAPPLRPADTPLDAATAGAQAVKHLHQQNTDGFIDLLMRMRDAGITTLDFSGQTLSEGAVACLARALSDHPTILRDHITGIDLRDARLDLIWPLLDAVKDHPAAALGLLDLSGTRVLSTLPSDEARYGPLEQADLHRVAAIVAHCPGLHTLQLNGQTGLSTGSHRRLGSSAHAKTPPMRALAIALHQSAVVTLELRDCGLWASDANYLDPAAIGEPARATGLRSIDLRGNDEVLGDLESPVLQCALLIELVAGFNRHGGLQALYLPNNALERMDNTLNAAALSAMLARPAFGQLLTLEPFSSSTSARFAAVRQELAQHAAPREEPVLPPLHKDAPFLVTPSLEQARAPDGPRLNAAMAGLQLTACLSRKDVPGAMDVLQRMRDAGIHTINFSGQRLEAEDMVRLDAVLKKASAHLIEHITAFDVSGATVVAGLKTLHPILERCRAIESLDLSGTRHGGNSALGEYDIALLLDKFPHLRELQLNMQPRVFFDNQEYLENEWQILPLTKQINRSRLTKITMRDCIVSHAFMSKLRSGSLQSIDLGDKTGPDCDAERYGAFDHPPSWPGLLPALAKQNPGLETLCLREDLLEWFDRDECKALLAEICGAVKNTSLTRIEPFSSSTSHRFTLLKQVLAANKERLNS